MRTDLTEIASELQSNGFAPKYKKKLVENPASSARMNTYKTVLTGVSFFVNSIVKQQYIDYYKTLCGDCIVTYDSNNEEVNIDLCVSKAVDTQAEKRRVKHSRALLTRV